MWNRADLKANAKKIFFGNYWKAVLVTLILTIILGGATNTITRRISNNQSTDWSIDQDFSGVSMLAHFAGKEWKQEEFQIISQQIGQLIRIFPVFQVMMNGQMMKY